MANEAVLKAIEERRSIRGYKKDQITKAELDALLKAAVEAPSAMNAQPWHFTVVQNQALLDELNQEIAKNFKQDTGDVFYGAPTVIIISCDPVARWARFDSGLATQNIALAATGLGLGSIILGMPEAAFAGDKKDYFQKKLKFPEGKEFAVAIAVGYAATTKEAHPVKPDLIDYAD